jgi:outer membrane protein OmpA-like peptidoglycan-associated protein
MRALFSVLLILLSASSSRATPPSGYQCAPGTSKIGVGCTCPATHLDLRDKENNAVCAVKPAIDHTKLGDQSLAAGDCEKAVEHYTKALEQLTDLRALVGIGTCAIKTKELRKAEHLFRYLAEETDAEPVLAGLAEAFQKQDKKVEAVAAWRRYLEKYPGSEKALGSLRMLGTARKSLAGPKTPSDADGDGIADGADQCPEEPESINGTKDDDGCPDSGEPVVVLLPAKLELLQAIRFERSRPILAKSSFGIVAQVASVLRAHPEIVRLRIGCHVDFTSNTQKDEELSERRAKALRDWIVASGISPTRVEAKGFGSTRSIVGPGPTSRLVNERVELLILEMK